jgi:hypothetical protein
VLRRRPQGGHYDLIESDSLAVLQGLAADISGRYAFGVVEFELAHVGMNLRSGCETAKEGLAPSDHMIPLSRPAIPSALHQRAVCPPSTMKAVPVMNADSLEARNDTLAAISEA